MKRQLDCIDADGDQGDQDDHGDIVCLEKKYIYKFFDQNEIVYLCPSFKPSTL